MVVNYVREQLELGLIQVLKIKGELNNADLHTKRLRLLSRPITSSALMQHFIRVTQKPEPNWTSKTRSAPDRVY
jgi:hypothetical protein